MYAVSEAYLEKIASRSVQTNWYGSITTTIGTVYSFDLSTIVEGSGKITREICPKDNIVIGSTCAAELDISLVLPNVERYELYKGTITLFFQLKIDNSTWETVPVGVFKIAEPPERSQNIVTIHAYDAMLDFNKDFGLYLQGSPYYLLSYACNVCGVELGTTQEEIFNYTNGSVDTYTYQEIEIYTYRDLVGYIASYLCCYAYIGVDGKLYVKPYTMDVAREVSPSWRFDYKPKDYEAFYSAISAYFAVTEQTETITLGGTGLLYEMGINPLIQFNADEVRTSVLTNIITSLAEISYTPFIANVPCDPALMVGDVLNFTGNHAVDGKLSAITKQVIKIHGDMEVSCAGSDPNLNVLTEKEKQIYTASQSNNKDGMYYYDYANAEEITIDDGETVRVIVFNYVSTKESHVDFHAEIKGTVETTEVYNAQDDSYTEKDGVIRVTYRLGGADVVEYYPADTFSDGVHLLHLLYTWWASANILSNFEVFIKCEGCSLTIERGASRGYLAGIGLVGEGGWDGSVYVYEDFYPVNFGSIRKDFEEEIESSFYTPVAPEPTQSVVRRNFFSTIFKSFTENVGLTNLHRFSVLYNSGEMAYDHTVVSGSVWTLEEGATTGTVTTPNCTASQITQITSKNSGSIATYVVSFDGGDTWWSYANGWIEPDYSMEIYGMLESTMRSIPTERWAEKLNGTIMVRAVLNGSATLGDIQIYTEGNINA